MAGLRPIHYRKFEKFLLYIGCHFVRQRGDHKAYLRSDLIRPVIEIKSNFRTLGISNEEYLEILKKL